MVTLSDFQQHPSLARLAPPVRPAASGHAQAAIIARTHPAPATLPRNGSSVA